MNMYYLRYKLNYDGNATLTSQTGTRNTVLELYRCMLAQGYKFILCQLWSNNGFEYTIV